MQSHLKSHMMCAVVVCSAVQCTTVYVLLYIALLCSFDLTLSCFITDCLLSFCLHCAGVCLFAGSSCEDGCV